jgi:hypothetical protein
LQFTKNVAWVGEIEVACNILVEILLGKWSLGGPGRSWENNIKMNLRKTSCKFVNQMQVSYDCVQCWTFVLAGMNFRFPC